MIRAWLIFLKRRYWLRQLERFSRKARVFADKARNASLRLERLGVKPHQPGQFKRRPR